MSLSGIIYHSQFLTCFPLYGDYFFCFLCFKSSTDALMFNMFFRFPGGVGEEPGLSQQVVLSFFLEMLCIKTIGIREFVTCDFMLF